MINIEDVIAPDDHWFEAAVEGIRLSYESMDKSDSYWGDDGEYYIGENDFSLMRKLCMDGDGHDKFLRTLYVNMRITAPIYWWKELDTYKVGTTRLSDSTMHNIMKKKFDIMDFSYDSLNEKSVLCLFDICQTLNEYRELWIAEEDKKKKKELWEQVIVLLPSSYNQTSRYICSYATLKNILIQRKGHKLDEWAEFIFVTYDLPYFWELFCARKYDEVDLLS